MSNPVTIYEKNLAAIESALVKNDISKLTTQEQISLYNETCKSVGLNSLTKPFAFLEFQGRKVMYATKDCTEQLRKIHGVSTTIKSHGVVNDCYEVHVVAKDATGRQDEDIAVIPLGRASGNDLANLRMKCVTKAKRRVTLSICGLGILDESELDTIAHNLKKTTDNPQITNPLKDVKQIEEAPAEIPEVFQDEDLGEFVCKVGKKHADKKLSDFDAFELDKYIKSTKVWFKDQKRTPSADWNEFFDKAEAYLCSLEFDPNEPMPA